jgi:hypothetical protein
MKTYAFVRSNVPRALNNGKLKLSVAKNQILKTKDNTGNDYIKQFISNKIYFLFYIKT